MVVKTDIIYQYCLDFKMPKYLLTALILFSAVQGEDNYIERFAIKINLNSLAKESQKSVVVNDRNINLKPMLASLAIPGLGQVMNKSPIWKTALFATVEVAGIAGYLSWTNQADEITKEYKQWADDHWEMDRWVNTSSTLLSTIQSNGYPSVDDIIINGSHHITIIVDGRYESSDILAVNPNTEYIEVRDWDFYEGIGKYDQFVAGWDDALTDWRIEKKDIAGGGTELIVMTPNKKHYLDLRNDSNILYRNAKFAITVVVFNHIFSALDALWNTNNKKELSYRLDVTQQINQKYVIKGLVVEWEL